MNPIALPFVTNTILICHSLKIHGWSINFFINGRVIIPSRQCQVMNEILSNNVTKTNEKYVFITVVSCITCIIYFGLWMLGVVYDMLVMVVNFINNSWEPTHLIIGIFEVQNIIVVPMTNQVIFLFNSFDLLNKIIVYVKSKGLNLNTLIKAWNP